MLHSYYTTWANQRAHQLECPLPGRRLQDARLCHPHFRPPHMSPLPLCLCVCVCACVCVCVCVCVLELAPTLLPELLPCILLPSCTRFSHSRAPSYHGQRAGRRLRETAPCLPGPLQRVPLHALVSACTRTPAHPDSHAHTGPRSLPRSQACTHACVHAHTSTHACSQTACWIHTHCSPRGKPAAARERPPFSCRPCPWVPLAPLRAVCRPRRGPQTSIAGTSFSDMPARRTAPRPRSTTSIQPQQMPRSGATR